MKILFIALFLSLPQTLFSSVPDSLTLSVMVGDRRNTFEIVKKGEKSLFSYHDSYGSSRQTNVSLEDSSYFFNLAKEINGPIMSANKCPRRYMEFQLVASSKKQTAFVCTSDIGKNSSKLNKLLSSFQLLLTQKSTANKSN